MTTNVTGKNKRKAQRYANDRTGHARCISFHVEHRPSIENPHQTFHVELHHNIIEKPDSHVPRGTSHQVDHDDCPRPATQCVWVALRTLGQFMTLQPLHPENPTALSHQATGLLNPYR